MTTTLSRKERDETYDHYEKIYKNAARAAGLIPSFTQTDAYATAGVRYREASRALEHARASLEAATNALPKP